MNGMVGARDRFAGRSFSPRLSRGLSLRSLNPPSNLHKLDFHPFSRPPEFTACAKAVVRRSLAALVLICSSNLACKAKTLSEPSRRSKDGLGLKIAQHRDLIVLHACSAWRPLKSHGCCVSELRTPRPIGCESRWSALAGWPNQTQGSTSPRLGLQAAAPSQQEAHCTAQM